jgi:hypothetical protein
LQFSHIFCHLPQATFGILTGKNQFLQNEEDFVLPSGVDLFYFYRQTILFLATLSTGKSFLNLCRMLSRNLRNYAEMLLNKYPKYVWIPQKS